MSFIIAKNPAPIVAGFISSAPAGPFLYSPEDWSIGIPGTNPYGVLVRSTGVDQATHTSSGSIM